MDSYTLRVISHLVQETLIFESLWLQHCVILQETSSILYDAALILRFEVFVRIILCYELESFKS